MKQLMLTDKIPAYINLLPNYCKTLTSYDSMRSVTTEVTDCPVCCETKVISLGNLVAKSKIGDNKEKYRWLRARVELTKDCNFPFVDMDSLRINVKYVATGRYSRKVISEGEVSRIFSPDIVNYLCSPDYTYNQIFKTFFHLEQKVDLPVNQERGMQIRVPVETPEEVTFKINRVYISGYTNKMYGAEDENVIREWDTTKNDIIEAKHFLLYDSENDTEFSPYVFSVSPDTHKVVLKFDMALENLFDMQDWSEMSTWFTDPDKGPVRTWEDVMNDDTIPLWTYKDPNPVHPCPPPKDFPDEFPIGIDLSKINSETEDETEGMNLPRDPKDW